MSQPSLMSMLTNQMHYSTQRQSVLAENIANLDTPNYQASDLKKPDFSSMATSAAHQLGMRQTSGKHLSGTAGNQPYRADKDRKNYETTPTGNSVVLEEQMAKLSETGAEYQMSSSLFRKFHTLYRTALGNR